MNPTTFEAARRLLGTAFVFLTLATSLDAQAQQVAQAQTAQANPMEVPEQVLITGSLIRGTAAVGVPVTNLSPAGTYRTTRRAHNPRIYSARSRNSTSFSRTGWRTQAANV